MRFWIVAGAMLVAALAIVVLPLWRARTGSSLGRTDVNKAVYRDKLTELAGDLVNGTLNAEQFEQARADLERSLLQDVADGGAASPRVPGASGSGRWAALLVAFAVPIAALGFYYATGDHATGVSQSAAQNIAPDGQDEAGAAAGQMHPVEQMLMQLTQRLAKQPQDGEGWALAGRTYAYLHRYAEAVLAYEKAAKLLPPNPQLLADYADALAAVGGKGLAGKPTELVQQALVLDPNHPKALWLAGTAAFDLGNYKEALADWRRLQGVLPPGSEEARNIVGSIAEAEARGEVSAPAASADTSPAGPSAAAAIRGVVRLDPKLAAQVKPDDTLFIFARAENGPPMPLAVVRRRAAELPIEFTLDDSLAMLPSMKLSNFPRVVVGARISRSGNAMPQSGDLQGSAGAVNVAAAGRVEITINSVTR